MKHVVLILTTTLTILPACQAGKEVKPVWGFIQERPDSALAMLEGMDAASFHGRGLAEYRLLKAMALEKSHVDVTSDSLALPAYLYFLKHGPREKEMMGLYCLSVARFNARAYAEAVPMLEEVTDLAGRQGSDLYVGMGSVLLSQALERMRCTSEAARSAERGVAAFEAVPDSFRVRRARLRLADAYGAAEEYGKALGIYRDLINSFQKDTSIMRQALVHGAYSMYLAHPERADSAMSYYGRAMDDYKAELGDMEAARFGEVAAASGNTRLAWRIVERLRASGGHPERRAYLEYMIYKKENDPFSALAAIEEFLALQDSLRVTPPMQSLIRGRQTYHELPGPASGRGLAAAKRPGAFSVLSLVLALVAAGLYFYGKYRHRNVSLEHERLIGSMGESARLLRESEIENAGLKENLQAIRMRYVAAYKKQFSRITTIIEKYYASSGMKNARDIVYKEVMDIAGTIGSDSTRMGVLERDVNAALDNAMKWFREEFPDKSPAYYNMVCLFMAGFTTPMIEIMTGVPRNTLYSKKRRLLEEIRGSDAVHKDLLMMMIK